MCTVELRTINPHSPNQLTATAEMRDQQNQHQRQYRQYSCQHKARPGWDERDYRMSNLTQGTSSLARPQEPAQQETKTTKQRSQVPPDWIPTCTVRSPVLPLAKRQPIPTHRVVCVPIITVCDVHRQERPAEPGSGLPPKKSGSGCRPRVKCALATAHLHQGVEQRHVRQKLASGISAAEGGENTGTRRLCECVIRTVHV